MTIVPNKTSHFFNGVYNDLDKVGVPTSHLCMWRKPGGEDQTRLVESALEFSYDILRGDDLVSDINPRSQIEAEHNIGGNIKTKVEQQYQNVGNLFPIIKEQAGASYDQTFKALAGELGTTTATGDAQRMARAKELITQGVKSNLKKMGRRFNLIASEALRTGKITLNDGSQYNFDRAAANTGTPFATWDNASTATPIADLVSIYEPIRDNGNCDPNFVGLGADAANSFFNTNEITNLINLRGSTFIYSGKDTRGLPALPQGYQRMVDSGWVYQAWLLSPEGYEFFIFVNNANYRLTKGGTRTNYQPKKDVLMMDPVKMRCDMFLGPKTRFSIDMPGQRAIESLFGISRLKTSQIMQTGTKILEPWMFNHDTWVNESRTFIGVESYTGPVTVPTAVDCAGSIPNVTA
jgi:hypothetical protein